MNPTNSIQGGCCSDCNCEGSKLFFCNGSCPCHQDIQPGKCVCDCAKVLKGRPDFRIDGCLCECHTPSADIQPEWEERFDEEFHGFGLMLGNSSGLSTGPITPVKDFIRTTVIPAELEAYRKDLLEKLREALIRESACEQGQELSVKLYDAIRQVKKIIGV